MFEVFRHLRGTPEDDHANDGMDAEHFAYRDAVGRCETMKPAVTAKQMSVANVVDRLRANGIPPGILRRAIAESFGDDAADRYAAE